TDGNASLSFNVSDLKEGGTYLDHSGSAIVQISVSNPASTPAPAPAPVPAPSPAPVPTPAPAPAPVEHAPTVQAPSTQSGLSTQPIIFNAANGNRITIVDPDLRDTDPMLVSLYV